MPLDASDLGAIWLTVKLASLTTLILLIVGTPIAWWLARTRSWLRGPVGAVVALPLVLPPTVIGFYLLIALGPHGWLGQATQALGLGSVVFSFTGLVIGSVIYSMPFVVQPLQNAFGAIGQRPLEVAATLRASPGTPSSTWCCRWPAGLHHRQHPRFRPHGGRVRRGVDDWRQHPRQDTRGLGADFRPCRGHGLFASTLAGGCHAGVLVPGAAPAVRWAPRQGWLELI